MHLYGSLVSRRGKTPLVLIMCLLLSCALFVAACGGSSDSVTSSSVKPSVTPPADLISKGTLTVGTNSTYPPQEYKDVTTGKDVGFDMDLITEMAKRMGLQVAVKQGNFDTIIDDLTSKRYDVVISGVTINAPREQKADFIPYFNAGQSLLVRKGNPEKIQSPKDLCGKGVGVQNTTVEQDSLTQANKACLAAGKPAIKVTALDSQNDVVQLLVDGRVSATYQDSPVTDYYMKLNPGQFQIGGSITDQAIEGIATRKGDQEMGKALKAAYDAVKRDGTYDKLFGKWGLNAQQEVR